MSTPIIAAIRHLAQQKESRLATAKESLVHTAQELAHLASIYGVARVSYSFLARKCRCSRRTVMRHIQALIDREIIKKSVLWTKVNFCDVNTYTFRLTWETRPAALPSDKRCPKLPPPRQTSEKCGSIGEEIHTLEKGLGFCTPGSDAHTTTQAKLAHLRTLLAPQEEGAR